MLFFIYLFIVFFHCGIEPDIFMVQFYIRFIENLLKGKIKFSTNVSLDCLTVFQRYTGTTTSFYVHLMSPPVIKLMNLWVDQNQKPMRTQILNFAIIYF